MSRALLKLSGSLVHDYATISTTPRVLTAPRARRAATSAGNLDILAPGGTPSPPSTPAATQRCTIVPPRQRFTWRCTGAETLDGVRGGEPLETLRQTHAEQSALVEPFPHVAALG